MAQQWVWSPGCTAQFCAVSIQNYPRQDWVAEHSNRWESLPSGFWAVYVSPGQRPLYSFFKGSSTLPGYGLQVFYLREDVLVFSNCDNPGQELFCQEPEKAKEQTQRQFYSW